jgi:hypothetical protein
MPVSEVVVFMFRIRDRTVDSNVRPFAHGASEETGNFTAKLIPGIGSHSFAFAVLNRGARVFGAMLP